jgi:hypothetical protein
MGLGTFYAVVAGTCFALVGLWWNVVERHPAWHTDAAARRQAGGVYLSFLLPGMMGLFAQIDPGTPAIWRSGFLLCAAIGGWSAVSLIRSQDTYAPGLLGRNRWLVVVLYGLVMVLAVAPEAAEPLGLAPLQAGGLLLVLLVAAAHGLTWELMLERRPADRPGPAGA